MIKSDIFQNITKTIIQKGDPKSIGRLSDFVDRIIVKFPEKALEYFPFLPDLIKYCIPCFSSTTNMFIDLLNINMNCFKIDQLEKFLIDEKYYVICKLDPKCEFYNLPLSLHHAIKNTNTSENWLYLLKLTNFSYNIPDLSFIVDKAAQIIEPVINDAEISNKHQKNDSVEKNEYKRVQVYALKFLTKMIECHAIYELSVEHEKIINDVINVMKFFQHQTFAIKAAIDFCITAIKSDEMRNEIITIVFPFFTETIQENDPCNKFLIAFCKYCIDTIYMIDDDLTKTIPGSVITECCSWSKINKKKK